MTFTNTMNIINTTRQFHAASLFVSRKQKPVLKRLKACKPGGHGRFMSVAPAIRRLFIRCFQELGTDQWTLSRAFADQQ